MIDTDFDAHERSRWAGRADAYERSFGRLCAYPAEALLDAAGVRAGRRVIDVGTGPGPVAAAALAVGDPAAGVAELRRVVGPGGRVGVTLWPSPHPPLQRLWGEALAAAGVQRQPAGARERIRREYERLSAAYRDADGILRLPTAALLGSARVG